MTTNTKLFLAIAMIFTTFFLWKTTRNVQDPLWVKLKNLDLAKLETLHNSPSKIQSLFESFHNDSLSKTLNATEVIAKPYLPLMEYNKFEGLIDVLEKDKRIVISTVEGGGSTTLMSRIAYFVAIEDRRILNIKCAPQFDLIYHKKYIGESIDGRYKKGELLLFWEECLKNPDKKYIALFDDFDVINPETLFGPDLWENIANQKYKKFVAGEEVIIPDNFYMISSTLSAIGSRHQLHNEHFKRIGRNIFIEPNSIELALYIDKLKNKINLKINKHGLSSLSKKDLNINIALNDSNTVHNFLYFFQKTNQIIENDVARTRQLAQWSNIRKLFQAEDQELLMNTFISHVNAISPNK